MCMRPLKPREMKSIKRGCPCSAHHKGFVPHPHASDITGPRTVRTQTSRLTEVMAGNSEQNALMVHWLPKVLRQTVKKQL